jgi:hypothetical protein
MDMVCAGMHRQPLQEPGADDVDLHDIDSAIDNYAKQVSVRRGLLREFAVGGQDSALKCHQIVQNNMALRYPLFWILARESPNTVQGINKLFHPEGDLIVYILYNPFSRLIEYFCRSSTSLISPRRDQKYYFR